MRTIFGRDPALIASGVAGIVALLGSVVFDWNGDTIGTVNAALAAALAVYVAWGTVDKASAAILQLTKALLVVAVTFGAHITADQTALVIVAVEGVVGAFMRTQLTAVVPGPVAQVETVSPTVNVYNERGAVTNSTIVTVLVVIVLALAALWLGSQLFDYKG